MEQDKKVDIAALVERVQAKKRNTQLVPPPKPTANSTIVAPALLPRLDGETAFAQHIRQQESEGWRFLKAGQQRYVRLNRDALNRNLAIGAVSAGWVMNSITDARDYIAFTQIKLLGNTELMLTDETICGVEQRAALLVTTGAILLK